MKQEKPVVKDFRETGLNGSLACQRAQYTAQDHSLSSEGLEVWLLSVTRHWLPVWYSETMRGSSPLPLSRVEEQVGLLGFAKEQH